MKRYAALKRITDVLLSLPAILLLLIPWLIAGAVIKIQSPGPVIYKAKRVGLNGRIFTLYKLRTMCTDSGRVHATTLEGDPRVFPFGRFLRGSKLDETPQLFNILKGDMSVIGPRPEDEVNAPVYYSGKYREILSVLPGLSSPASLYDYTHGESYPDEESYVREFMPRKLELEMYYVRHRSFAYDLRIMLRTAAVLTGKLIFRAKIPEPKEMKLLYGSSEELSDRTIGKHAGNDGIR